MPTASGRAWAIDAWNASIIWPDSVHDVLVPVALLGVDLGLRPGVMTTAIALSMVSMTSALIWIHRADIRLEAAQ